MAKLETRKNVKHGIVPGAPPPPPPATPRKASLPTVEAPPPQSELATALVAPSSAAPDVFIAAAAPPWLGLHLQNNLLPLLSPSHLQVVEPQVMAMNLGP